MSDYKVTYFDFDGGRGEPVRIALHAAGIAFEDVRWSFPQFGDCLLYTSPSPRDKRQSRMPSSA